MDTLTEHQFHTVWTEAVGRKGYNKKLFQEVLRSLKEKNLILSDLDDEEGYQKIKNLRQEEILNITYGNPTEEYQECNRCDGCGWYEGGKTIQTKCEVCHGTGKIKIIK
jgi:hypothetical protein